ncbi:MAG TPA: signal peptidase I [Chthoniobacterales bacterium]|nr:signal peptidase I [Chthoniobacterales bacterium]
MKFHKPIFVCAALAAAASLAMVMIFLSHIRLYQNPTVAMQPTLTNGDRIVAEDFTYLWRRPARGEVVAFHSKGLTGVATDSIFVKRVIGLPGETIQIKDHKAYVDGVPFSKPGIRYTNLPTSSHLSSEADSFTVPSDSYFVLGDNSDNSLDSRFFGAIPAGAIISRVAMRCWPPGRIGLVQ